MTLWLNIYAKDVRKLSVFYEKIGFKKNANFKFSDHEASFVFDNKVTLMIFKEGFFDALIESKISVPKSESTILFSFDMPSIQEADELVNLAIQEGGKPLNVSEQAKNPNFYNTGFIDLEGHLWNILVMSK